MGRLSAALVIIGILASGGGCRQSDDVSAHPTDLARVRSGDLDVVLLARNAALAKGKDTATIEFRAASGGSLVDVGAVKAGATMPMPGMAPMFSPVAVEPASAPGRYLATSDLGMAGEWRLIVEWDGPAGRGSVTFPPAVQ